MSGKYLYSNIFILGLLIAGCAKESNLLPEPVVPPVIKDDLEIRLTAEIDQINTTRADDSGFADGDVIGIFGVDFKSGQSGILMPSGNNTDNKGFKYYEKDDVWKGTSALEFSDEDTPMEIYGYYPYNASIANVNQYPISVEIDQAENPRAYEASDFLWAKSEVLRPSSPSVHLHFKHILSVVRVTLTEGEGFEKGEWSQLEKHVRVSSIQRNATVDLSNGSVAIAGDSEVSEILMKPDKSDFRAVVLPQDIKKGDPLIKVVVGEEAYTLFKEETMTYYSGKQHNFTIEVAKTTDKGDYEFVLVDESITAWESDLTSHNGETKEYVVVNVSSTTNLQKALKDMKLDPKEIENMKIIGPMHEEDFPFMRSELIKLESLNMYEATLSFRVGYFNSCIIYEEGLPEEAFLNMYSLRHFIFPKKLKCIGRYAFQGTSLSGSLVIPEGVEEIGYQAFTNVSDWGDGLDKNNLTGTLTLPSTLKNINTYAFRGCDFSGELLLPESIEEVGMGAFEDCRFLTGDLRLPNASYVKGAFKNMKGLSGRFVLPTEMTEIPPELFAGCPISSIEWPSNLNSIGDRAFSNCDFKRDFHLPESVKYIGEYCFYNTNLRHITLPSELTTIKSRTFYNCGELCDTLVIPSKVEVIEEDAFVNCLRIEALILPSKIEKVGENAFGNTSFSYIRSDALVPPIIETSAFSFVNREDCRIEVPENSVQAYRQASGWNEFKKISAYRNFVASPSKINLLNNGIKNMEIILYADNDWEITECPAWCHVDRKSGSKKTTLMVNVEELSKGSDQRIGKISFRLNGDDNYLTHIDVSQYDYEYNEDEMLILQKASKGNGINLVFIGDGYDATDIASGTYLQDMKQEMEYFFGVEPYSSYREYFNVFTAFALSEDSGVESVDSWKRTKFKVCFGGGGKKGDRISADWQRAMEYCAENIPMTTGGSNPHVGCILVGNSDIYDGVTYTMGDSFCSVVTKSSWDYPMDARGLVQHEAGGHGIGWLGDEYIYHKAWINNCSCGDGCGHALELQGDLAVGYSKNLSMYGRYDQVPWAHLIKNNNYSDIVDIYEGGYFHSRGVYRSEYNSCMNNNVPYFSTWSRQLIVERIMKLAGEKFDLQGFYDKDSRAVGRDFTIPTRNSDNISVVGPSVHSNAPRRIVGYKYGKKGVTK